MPEDYEVSVRWNEHFQQRENYLQSDEVLQSVERISSNQDVFRLQPTF